MIIFRVGVHKNPIIEDYGVYLTKYQYSSKDLRFFIELHLLISYQTKITKEFELYALNSMMAYQMIPIIWIFQIFRLKIVINYKLIIEFMRNKNNFGFQDMFLFQKSRQKSSWPELQFNKNLDVQYKWMPNHINYLEDDVRYYYDFG